MANADLTRLINSDEVQTIVKPPKVSRMVVPLKKNPLKNLGALLKLNPYAKAARRAELLAQVRWQAPLLGIFHLHFRPYVSICLCSDSSIRPWVSMA